ncbi:sensor histidine kinase [Bacillus sp. H-16]|uniref:sensor histidine kinase n=1 Tax=Alteribacter salitolerans TaxID=2912333 RepID=UPI0019654A60|nr:histidine kinase [Alteribacter salitolerans]MBM7095086.1 sensor histidine kinase [Alteribacter salitolerans]
MRLVLWIGLFIVMWGFGLNYASGSLLGDPLRLALSTLFFTGYFLLPLFRKKEGLQLGVFLFGAGLLPGVFWPEPDWGINVYHIMIVVMISGEAVYRLRLFYVMAVESILLLGLALPALAGVPGQSLPFIGIFAALLVMGTVMIYERIKNARQLNDQYEALLIEFRKLKRTAAAGEANIRQEERTQIAREIHDSVGHKLTALLMQLEVFRIQAAEKDKDTVIKLKELARDSLEETRHAVKALKKDEAGGLPAVIRLIRKLEAESFLRVHFKINHGALTAPLRNDQAIAVYRAVQEALTNMMKHSGTKEVDIIFEVPGGTVFRFEVRHKTWRDETFQEGFGLISMRERMEEAGGGLEAENYSGSFIVRGTFPLFTRKGGNDG